MQSLLPGPGAGAEVVQIAHLTFAASGSAFSGTAYSRYVRQTISPPSIGVSVQCEFALLRNTYI